MAFKFTIFFLLLIASIVTSQKPPNFSKINPIKTIRAKHGDIIDCVDIYKQPAFNHPALKNHTIQMKSSHLNSSSNQTSKAASQVWQKYGRCPSGTVPIRRSTNNKNNHQTISNSSKIIVTHNHQTISNSSKIIVTQHHSFSVALTTGFSYSGAKANIKIWNPYVESNDDYSSSQVMLRNGPLQTFDAIHAGWAVNPRVYNDNNTHLFGYWTADGMQNIGCFDLTCPGFVQTSGDIALGAYVGDLYGSEITIRVSKDPNTQNWWFIYNDHEVGYWPGDIFQVLRYQATLVQWGGEVYSPKVGTEPHTGTGMGSGKFADFVFGSSGTIKGILIEENSNPLKEPETLFVSSDEWDCYDAYVKSERWSPREFYYGGPGSRNNPRC